MEILSLAVGILGFVATGVGSYFSYISFINPWIRFKKYLKNPSNWEEGTGTDSIEIFRHKEHPEYQIIIDSRTPFSEDYKAPWMKSDGFSRRPNPAIYVRLKGNGILLKEELFIYMNDFRTFVPCPKIISEQGNQHYWYNRLQVQLANIISRFSTETSIEEFASHQKEMIGINMDL